MAKHRTVPEVNAGSMADIAFLLLIFFLVTATIETDLGIDRKLPPKNQLPPPILRERNVLRVSLNKNNKIFVEDEVIPISELKKLTIKFLDNGGSKNGETGYCDYCQGIGDKDLSDNPSIAVIALKADREASYAVYVSIQDQFGAAYTELRNREAFRLFGRTYESLKTDYYDPYILAKDKLNLKTKIEKIRDMFPQKISEAQTIIK